MPFRKQSGDPWDRKPDKRPAEPRGPKESPVDTLKSWNKQRKATAREREDAKRLPPEKCPWCGKDMEQGFLIGGRDIIRWYPGIYKFAWFVRDSTGSFHVDDDGDGLARYKITWLCRDCKKMVFNAPVPEDEDDSTRNIFTSSYHFDETKEEEESGE